MRRGVLAAVAAAFMALALSASATAATGDTDVSVGLRAMADRVQTGGIAYFDTGVVNDGPNDATGVIITVQLPAGMTFIPAMSDPACTGSGQTVTCPVGTLWNHAVTDAFRLAAQTSTLGTFTANATVSFDQNDVNPSNNAASATVTVYGPADVAVSLHGPTQVDVQSTNSLTIDVTNGGPDTAGNATLDLSLAPQLSPAGLSSTQGTCTGDMSTTPMTVHCDLGDISAGGTAEVVLRVYAYQQGTGTTVAKAASDRPDSDQSNNTASLSTTVVPVADVSVAGGPSVTSSKNRSSVTFTVVVYDGGPSGATSVVLADTWSGTVEVELSSISTDHGTCSKAGATSYRCNLGTLAPGEAATVTVTVTAHGSGAVTDTAVATSSVKDPNSSNNQAVLTASV